MKRSAIRQRSVTRSVNGRRAAAARKRRALEQRIALSYRRRSWLIDHPRCQGGAILQAAGDPAASRCLVYACEIHEIRKRSRGGDPDPYAEDSTCIALCRPCHRFTEEHPRRATDAGLLLHAKISQSKVTAVEGGVSS